VNVKEAIAAYLESSEAHGESVRAARIEGAAAPVFELLRSVFEELAKGRSKSSALLDEQAKGLLRSVCRFAAKISATPDERLFAQTCDGV
jgi:hypothetical protein